MPNQPLVSIVTPSKDQATFLTECLLSVQRQAYPELEHIVVDGGSKDGTVDLLKAFSNSARLRWISEPDRGQSEALNKGFAIARGEIVGWLNADDWYLPGAVTRAVARLKAEPRSGWVHGDGYAIDAEGTVLRRLRPGPLRLKDLVLGGMLLVQPSLFFRRDALEAVGAVAEDIHTTMDEDFCLRLALLRQGSYIPEVQAVRRRHAQSKSARLATAFCGDTLKALDNFYSRGDLPDEIQGLRPLAYARRYAVCANRMFMAGKYSEAKALVRKAIGTAPGHLLSGQPALAAIYLQSSLRINWLNPGLRPRLAEWRFRVRHPAIRLGWDLDATPVFQAEGASVETTGETSP